MSTYKNTIGVKQHYTVITREGFLAFSGSFRELLEFRKNLNC